nr:hypothetical protein [Sicyoidochytrium minutum DNA virus]
MLKDTKSVKNSLVLKSRFFD